MAAYRNPENAEKFSDLSLPVLLNVAEAFGVDVSNVKDRTSVLADLSEEGVTFEMFKGTLESELDAAKEKKEDLSKVSVSSETVIVRMVRDNRSYQFRGKTFTQSHPIVLMNEDDADYLFENVEGFRPATPKETREFYS